MRRVTGSFLHVNKYFVDLQFKDADFGTFGIHNKNMGTNDVGSVTFGAFWHNLTTTTVQVTRSDDDLRAGQVRIRIWMYE